MRVSAGVVPTQLRAMSILAAGLLSVVPLAAQTPPEEWRISPPVYSTAPEAVSLHRVAGAAVVGGGVVVADAGNARLLLISPDGVVTDSLGRPGSGPGEFDYIHKVRAIGDTVVAYDGVQNRVTLWVPGTRGTPHVVRLPTLAGPTLTEFHEAVSANTWILGTRESGKEGPNGLRDVYTTVLAFDAASRETATLGRRKLEFDYFITQVFSSGGSGSTGYRMDFLGSAHIGSAPGGRWFFVPMDRPVIELIAIDPGGSSEIALPLEMMLYADSDWRRPLDSLLAISRGSSRDRIRTVYKDLEREVPRRTAPPARRALRMGRFLWIKRYDPGPGPGAEWLVADLVGGSIHATVMVDDDWTILAGTEDQVTVLTRTDLGEEVVQVRAIER